MTTPAHRPAITVVAVLGSVVVGGIMAMQPRVNGELAVALDDAVLTALISFGVGLLVCTIALMVSGPGRRGIGRIRAAVTDRRMSPWFLVGGAAGAFMVLTQGLATPLIGVAAFTVALVGGQLVGSLVVDGRGIGDMAPKRLTLQRMIGAALAIAAVVWSVSERLVGDIPWWALVLPFLAGAGTSWQQAVNGQLRREARSVVSATFVSFLAGTIVLALAAAVDLVVSGPPEAFPPAWWLYTGGLLGVVFIAFGAAVVPVVGVLLFGLATIAGQLGVAVLIDVVAPVSDAPLGAATIGGAMLAIAAVAVATVRLPRRRGPATGSRGASTP